MEAGFDNANAAATNPFANANGATELLGANDGFMLDIGRLRTGSLAEGFYANGNKNDDMFDDEDDDMGPETDVDALDDVAASPAPAAATAKEVAMGCELEEKVSKEIDASIFKSALNCSVRDLNLDQDEDDEHEEADLRAETPTPPADEVHDAGLDSDSEEDDEWNYIKGAKEQQQQPQQLPASPEQIAEVHTPEQQQQLLPEAIVEGNKESLQPPLPEKDLVDFEPELDFDKAPADASTTEEMDNMSQLNPDAKEFIPVSPTRNIDQPLCAALKDEQILAQSPRRPNPNCDFNLPDEDEFNQDVKNRPSDVYSNGHENGHNKSSQEIMENLLNGKNMDDIEFQPCKPASAGNEEFLFGPNAAAFSTPSKLMDQSRTSTKATFGDESLLDVSENETEGHTDGDLLSRLNKEDDPMSMSFYQDKDDVASPFDLNKVHELPETGDADTSFNETISDMPEHSPSEGMDASENKENIITTDLDAPESCLTGVCELPNSPNVSAFMQTDLDLEDKVVNDLAIQESMESLSEAPNAEISQDVNDRKFVTDDEIIERPQEPLLEIGSASTHPDLIAELDESQPEEIMMEPKAVICFESQDAEMQHDFCAEAVATSTSFSEPELITQTFTQEDIDSQDEQRIEEQQAPAIEDISNSSDVPQHEFILETSLESAQAPEPVIIEQTPEHEVAPELSPEPQLIEESLQEHEHIEAPVLSPIAIVENTPELPPVEAETPIESPIQEQVPIDHSQLDIKQEKDIMQDSLESPLKVVEPVITECLQQQEVAPIGDFTSHNVEEIPSPLDDVTSSVKDDSPVDQSKPIEEISSTIESEIINNTGPQILQEVGKIVDVANVALEKEVIVAPILAATELVQTESKVEKKIASAPKVKQTTTATKKPTSASASKTAAPKPSSKPMPKTTSATAPKTASMKPSTTLKTQKLLSASTAPKPATTGVKAPPKPRVSALSSSTRPTPVSDKKPLTNGDVKSTATKTAPIKRPLVPSKTTTAPASKPATTAAPKLSSRLGTSSSQAKPAPKVSAASTTSAPKPRPTTLASARTKTSTSAAPLSTSTAAKPLTMKTSGSAGAPPKAKPTSAPLSKPRVPLSARSAVAKAPDAEKQNKENVNKLTASRTATTRTTTRKIDSTAKSGLAPKTGTLASKTAASKKAMTSVKSVHKEPKQEKIVPNGVPAEKEKDIVPIDNTKEVSLLKDISPVSNLILDNSQLADTTAN